MKDERQLFAVCPDNEFFGRAAEIDRITGGLSVLRKHPSNIFVVGRRWTGKTEILRRVHRELYWSQSAVAPVYYQFKGYSGVENFSEDFLKEVLKQYASFIMRDPRAARVEVSLDKLEKSLLDEDLSGLADILAVHREARASGDRLALLRNALSAPRAITDTSGTPVYLILDDITLASKVSLLGEGPGIIKELMGSLSSGPFPYLAGSSTRRVLDGGVVNGSVELLELSGLDGDEAVSMMADLCHLYHVEFDSEVLAFAASKLEGNPMYIKNIIWAAHRGGRELVILKDFVDLYASEIAEGNMGLSINSALQLRSLADLRVLKACSGACGPVTEEKLADRFRTSLVDMSGILDGLASTGLLDVTLGSVRWAGDGVMRDFLNFIHETRVNGRSHEEARTALVREGLKDGFGRRGDTLRGRLVEDVSGLLNAFNGQRVLKILFDNQIFSSRFKNGLYRAENGDDIEVTLPQMAGCFESSRWEKNETGPPILIAHGFQNSRYDSGNEVVWLVAVKDSQAPLNLGDAENFIRRSQILKGNIRAGRVVRWVLSREGFTAEAQKRLAAEAVFSSDSAQMRIIRESLDDRGVAARLRSSGTLSPGKEYEVTLPSASKAELVAAKAVEEIGTEMGFDDASIGQIKTALIEACINAFEHSKVKSGKVFLKFIASGDKLTIHVQNRGVDFDGPPPSPPNGKDGAGLPHKRGWGFELMKGLMDEVRVERVSGGARIVLIKYLVRKGDPKGDKEA